MHFKLKSPRLLISLLAIAGAAFAISAFCSLYFDPEIAFYKKTGDLKKTWAKEISEKYGAKTVVYGGSSCAFSIDGERLLQTYGLPVANLGLHAGMGAAMLTNWALTETRPGDTLVVALEPGLLTGPLDPTPLATQFSFAMRSPAWLAEPWIEQSTPLASSLLALRFERSKVFSLLGKFLKRAPVYPYSLADVHASGWQTTARRRNFEVFAFPDAHLSHDARKLLGWLREWSEAHRVRVAYSLPWAYVSPERAEACRRVNLEILRQVGEFIPVLKDPRLGVCSLREDFADTAYHLTAGGALLRTDDFARQLKNWDTWKPDELKSLPDHEASR